ncbi:hypothetical protein INR49_003586, partial [Caranx melampygus]
LDTCAHEAQRVGGPEQVRLAAPRQPGSARLDYSQRLRGRTAPSLCGSEIRIEPDPEGTGGLRET